METDTPPLHETPLDALGPIVEEKLTIEGREFTIARPTRTDDLLDHPSIRNAFAVDEYMPYWVDLWPAARMLAKVILRETWTPGTHALELGCGLGLPGIAALARGLRVTFSDYDATALRFAADNARRNGFTDFATLRLDWRYPPADLKVPVVLAADLVYEMPNGEPLVRLIGQVLHPGGVCLLADQDRIPSQALPDVLTAMGMRYTTQIARSVEADGKRIKGTLYRISHGG